MGLIAQASGLATDARVVTANANSAIGVKVIGGRCTLVIVVRKD